MSLFSNLFLLSCRRERIKETSSRFSGCEILMSEYLVFKKLPLVSPISSDESDSYFCMLQPNQYSHWKSENIYLQVSARLLEKTDPQLARKIIFPTFDYHSYTPAHMDL